MVIRGGLVSESRMGNVRINLPILTLMKGTIRGGESIWDFLTKVALFDMR